MRLNLKNAVYNIAMALLIGMLMYVGAGPVAGAVTVPTVLAAGYVVHHVVQVPKGMVMMALQVEYWRDTIEQEIRKDNSFLFSADVVDKENIIQGKVVHLPQSGGTGEVIKNPTQFPLKVRQRVDSDVVYVLDYYATKPVRIPYIETKELSYDKRVSVLGEDLDKLKEEVADQMLYNWVTSPAYGAYAASTLPSANILAVTGNNGTDNADAPGGTGNRKMATLGDLQRMQTFFRRQNRWFEGMMYAMLPPAMLAEIAPADSVITATYMQSVTEQERREGVYMKIQGWKIMSRSSVIALDSDGTTIRTPDEATETTDLGAGLFWYKRSLETAIGEIVSFESLNDPQFHGDIYSFGIRFGGRCKRENYEGVALLRQAATT